MSNEGFLGRWSKRKLEVKQGKAVEAEPGLAPVAVPPPPFDKLRAGQASPGGGGSEAQGGSEVSTGGTGEGQPETIPPPTLEDVQALTADSDFTRFTAADVTPEVKNAAMKKLFADPRYNVMDGLDVYTGDYTKPDPIPATMLRQLASAKFLGLFKDEHKPGEVPSPPRDVADNPITQSVAKSEALPPAAPEPADDADPDLRLQQDHAAPGEDPGRGPG